MRPYREAEVLTEPGCSPGAPAVASSFPNKTFPPAVAGAIERPRLLEKLARVPQVALTTVVAGAGYGKTTLLAQWLNLFCSGEPNTAAGHPAKPQRGEDPPTFPASSNAVAGHPAKPVSGRFFWYQLDERDSDPSFLIKNLLAVTYPDRPLVETVARGLNSPKIDWERITSIILSAFAAETIRPAQSAGRPVKASRDPAEALVARPGDAHRAPVFLILDDFHSVERSKAVVDFLSALLRNRPPWLHLLLASRSRPPLALSRMRARGEVLEISEADLGFTREEVEEWLNRFQEQTGGGLAPEGDQVDLRVNMRVAGKEQPAGTGAHQAAPALEQLEPRAQVGDKEQPAGGRGGLMEMAGLA
ncbi:MAG: hypothetical protein M1553_06750, partial [Firmicutes bacterium]|nr:hypothetical protein [Bacillota bacterium]